MRFSRCASTCMHRVMPTGPLSSGFFGTSAAPWISGSPSPPRRLRTLSPTRTRIGQAAPTLDALPRATASTSARRSSLGHPSDNPSSPGPVPRPSIAPWPTPWLSAPGFDSYSPSLHVPSTKPPLSSVTTSLLSTSPPTPFIIGAPSMLSWTSTSFASRLLSVTFESFTYRLLSNLRTL